MENYEWEMGVSDVGTVVEIGEGMGLMEGLKDVMGGEVIELKSGVVGLGEKLEE
ncbi:hypothetical protein [Staphylococcus saprophyticus]|uniref:hypothetical protein n=1 Tax=Staphylococcus saprophyticus TaxID=29385 RepID=UPI001785BB05